MQTEIMKIFSPNQFRVRMIGVLFLLMAVVSFFVWNKNEQIRPFLSIFVCLVASLYLFIKSFDNEKVVITSIIGFGGDCVESTKCIEVFPDSAKHRTFYLSFKLKNKDAIYVNWPYYKTKEGLIYLFLPALRVD